MNFSGSSDERGLGEEGGFLPLAEINVTPFVDVMLVVLVIFMATAPLLASGLPVDPPKSESVRGLNNPQAVVITIQKNGETSIDGQITPPENLGAATRVKMGDDANRMVHLRGDKEAPLGALVSALDQLAQAKITRTAIIANPKSKTSDPQP